MKKLLLLLTAFTLLFISCEEEDESHEIEGTWQLTSSSYIENGTNYTEEIDDCEANNTINLDGNTITYNDFYYDGGEWILNGETWELEGAECISETESYTYSISGNTLNIEGDQETFVINGDTLTLTFDESSADETYSSTDIYTRI